MMSHLEQTYEFDIRMRLADERASAAGVVILASDIAEGFVVEKNGVKISAFDVDHAPVEPAFCYRIDFAGRSVFARTKPRLAVYSHIGRPAATEADLIPSTRKTYAGPLEVGDTITVRRPAAPAR